MWGSFYYGWSCFLGYTPDAGTRDDDSMQYVHCAGSAWIIGSYVLATFSVLVVYNVVLQYSREFVSRATSSAIFTAFVVLWLYDLYESSSHPTNYILGGKVGVLDVSAIIILIFGMEVYSRDPEPDVELLTQMPISLPKSVEMESIENNSVTTTQSITAENLLPLKRVAPSYGSSNTSILPMNVLESSSSTKTPAMDIPIPGQALK